MTSPQQRRELLKLIEAIHEGFASKEDYARVEEMVLSNPEALSLYLNAMDLHGTLAWDAAGCGADVFGAEPAILKQRFSPSRWPVWAGLATAAMVIATFLMVTFQSPNGENHLAVDPPESPTEGIALSDVPEVRLPEVIGPKNSNSKQDPPPEAVVAQDQSQFFKKFDDASVVSFINDQIATGWEENQVQVAPVADDSEWIRRIYLDLAGRIPTPDEAQTFIKSRSVDKREQVIAALAQSDDYSRHFASTWSTLLVGRSERRSDNRRGLFAYLQRQFKNNRSWRETATDLITAEGSSDEVGPANFLLAHLNNQAVPATAIATRVLLCQQIQCAQCHRHPDVPDWDQDKFWELTAFFQQAEIETEIYTDQETGEVTRIRRLVDRDKIKPTYFETKDGVMKVTYPSFNGEILPEDTPLRQQLAEHLVQGDRPQLAKAFVNRVWANLFGYGFTNPVDDMSPHVPVSHPDLLEGLAEAFVKSGYDVQRLVEWICLSKPYQLASQSDFPVDDRPDLGELPLFARMYVKPLSAEQLYDSLLIASGLPAEQLSQQFAVYEERENWMQQFFQALDTEENSESTLLDGTLPQALMMMNGELVQNALDLEENSRLRSIIARGDLSQTEKIEQLCLSALSRYPTSEEMAILKKLLRQHVKTRTDRNVPPQIAMGEGLRDVYWAYLNSTEFTVNH